LIGSPPGVRAGSTPAQCEWNCGHALRREGAAQLVTAHASGQADRHRRLTRWRERAGQRDVRPVLPARQLDVPHLARNPTAQVVARAGDRERDPQEPGRTVELADEITRHHCTRTAALAALLSLFRLRDRVAHALDEHVAYTRTFRERIGAAHDDEIRELALLDRT